MNSEEFIRHVYAFKKAEQAYINEKLNGILNLNLPDFEEFKKTFKAIENDKKEKA